MLENGLCTYDTTVGSRHQHSQSGRASGFTFLKAGVREPYSDAKQCARFFPAAPRQDFAISAN
jgi:hypothetical protein